MKDVDNAVSPMAAAFVRRLRAFADLQERAPITSHRKLVGQFIVAGKVRVRASLQTFFEDVLSRQSRFNEATTQVVEALYRDLATLEGGMLGARAEAAQRMAALEDQVRRLEAELATLRGGSDAATK